MKINFKLLLTGFFIGTADTVPGISGGTVAFLSGIYDQLMQSISYFTKEFSLKNFSNFLKRAPYPFLIPLLIGIFTGIVSMSHLMHYLLATYPFFTHCLFTGLVLGALRPLSTQMGFTLTNMMTLISSAVFTFWFFSTVHIDTPHDAIYMFFSGMLGITAMILPGISGAYLMVIIGKYEYLLSLAKNPSLASFFALVPFGLGALVSILWFSRLLQYLLTHHRPKTFAVLLGLMVGSLERIWPLQATQTFPQIGLSLALIAASAALVIFFERFSEKSATKKSLSPQG